MIDLEKYNYDLPEGLIRKQGIEPRDSARLFVYDTKTDTVTHAVFSELPKFLPTDSVMVLNNTKVVPARLFLKKETGGKIEVFVLANEIDLHACDAETEIPVLVDRKCMVGWKIYFPNKDYFEVARQEENKFFVKLHSEKNLEELLKQYGETPIPHYLEDTKAQPRVGLQATLYGNENEVILRKRYQTIFAEGGASVAAPTASLHFTEQVFLDLNAKGVEFSEVTLDVGMGTFAPLKDEHFLSGKLHSEKIAVSEEAAEIVNRAKNEHRQVIAVGTTAMRTLESCAKDERVQPLIKNTDIFIYPPYHFQIADILLTNFHVPKSSLMLLVDAFLADKQAKRNIMDLYAIAIEENYAFYSFGDSMLIL
ncbi:MAG: tRNA preQ1(34) S-adenosylmethionine ribosyltransferase-isomerase QueA [Candidatus Moranbacteria bacterium]|nr:tRNA preQ1(34) S-adenosylmethionine ribosyltransferase-isomerase QueA [Candidatus Moranbacteria bacterium]